MRDFKSIVSSSRLQTTTEKNFRDAVLTLQKTIPKAVLEKSGGVKFPEISTLVSIASATAEIEEGVDRLSGTFSLGGTRLRKGKYIVERWCLVSFPFAKETFPAAKPRSAVYIPIISVSHTITRHQPLTFMEFFAVGC